MLEFQDNSIQVAVRIRPMLFGKYNRHEVEKGAKLILQVEDSTTVSLINPEDSLDHQTFGFCHCYWSHDGYSDSQDGHLISDPKHSNGGKYCDQRKTYENFGKEIIQNAWSGYNTTLLTYGESGSGKSWSLLGQAANKGKLRFGFIPLLASELFRTIRDKEKTLQAQQLGNSSVIEVKLTMMEIYNEKIRDLLSTNSNSTKFKQTIKLREHPKRGFYVEGLRSVVISNAEEAQIRIEEGMQNRASIYTNFNLISSKATVIVGITLMQKCRNSKGDEVFMSSMMDFYDLPEERSEIAVALLPEVGHLNKQSATSKSFSFLEKVVKGTPNPPAKEDGEIHALKQKTDSNLMRLLQRALCGNSKSYMLATLSPSELSYSKTLSTLSFADKLQRMTTSPLVNEELTTKLTRELKIENEHLKKMVATGEFEKNEYFACTDRIDKLPPEDKDEFRKQMIDDIKSQIKDNERELKNLTQTHEERVKAAKIDKGTNDLVMALKKLESEKKYNAHLYNLNRDSQLTGRIILILPTGNVEFGCQKRKEPFTCICGPGIKETHGSTTVIAKDNKVTIRPNAPDCTVLVNGEQIMFECHLYHNDRLVLGGNQIWIFQNPRDPWADKSQGSKLSFQFVQEEIAMKSKFYTSVCERGPINLNLRTDILELIPVTADANAMSDDLEKDSHFSLLVVDDFEKRLNDLHGFVFEGDGMSEEDEYGNDKQVMVKLYLSTDEVEYLWTKGTFMGRYDKMKSMYARVQEDGLSNIPPNSEDDPFMEDLEKEACIGYGLLSLKPLAYLIEFQQSTDILDFITKLPIGSIKVEVTPCNDFFERIDDEKIYLSNPDEQLGNSLHFTFKMGSIDLPSKYKEIYCKYQFNQDSVLSTGKLDGKSAYMLGSVFKYERRVSIDIVTQKLLDYLENEFLVLSFFGKLRPKKMRNLFKSQYKYKNYNTTSGTDTGSLYRLRDYQKQVAELSVLKKSEIRLQQKFSTLRTLLDVSEEMVQESIPSCYFKKLLDAKNHVDANEIVAECTEYLKPKEEPEPPPKLSTYQKVSEVCLIM